MLSVQIYIMKSINIENQLNEKQRFSFAHFYFHSSNTSHLLYFSYNFFLSFSLSFHYTILQLLLPKFHYEMEQFIFFSFLLKFIFLSFFFDVECFIFSIIVYILLCVLFYDYISIQQINDIESGATFFKDDKE